MSVGQMSAALRAKILTQLEQAVKGKNSQLTERILKNHVEYSDKDAIRKQTNASSESIMSRGGLQNLKDGMQRYLEANSVAVLASNIVEQLDYDDFKNFLLTQYFKGEVKQSKRQEEGFTYSQPIRLSGSRKATKLIIAESSTDKDSDVLILKNIAYDKIVAYFKEYIKTKVSGLSPEEQKQLDKQLSAMFNAGHLVGVFTGRLTRAFDIRVGKSTGSLSIGGSTDPELQALFQNVLDLVTAADLLSSNIYNDVKLFARSEKQLTKNSAVLRFVTEVQISTENWEAGNLLTQAGKELTKLINAVNPSVSEKGRQKAVGDSVTKLMATLKPVRDYIVKRSAELKQQPKISKALEQELEKIARTTTTYETLISTAGSTPFSVHLEKIIADAIDGGKRAKTESSVAAVSKVLPVAKGKKAAPAGKLKSKTTRVKIKKTPPVAAPTSAGYSLASLQSLLQASLVAQVKKNMGDGNRRDVLNLRSGRLAESIEIERLSQSRQGMITVFYSYMKNPYATFSEGGRQEYPRSRDPKLLISKSIREIASKQVGDRLRAVVV